MHGFKRLIVILTAIGLLVVLFSRCLDTSTDEGYKLVATDSTKAGSATCIQCHKAVYDNYLASPHQKTSRLIEGHDLLQADSARSNRFSFDDHLSIAIERRDSGSYQVAYVDGEEQLSRRFDVAFGSGKDAITFATWRGTKLNQMQLTYFSRIKSWANSPGYRDKQLYFSRQIDMRCLECHTSYAEQKVESSGTLVTSQELVRSSVAYGIDCERCHGPAGKHAEFQLKHPEQKTAKFMTVYKSLTRKQRTDACSACHSGSDRKSIKSTFAFKAGDNLDEFIDKSSETVPDPDVHGQQMQMLAASACYIQSKTLDCNTCHTIHGDQTQGLTAYSKQCVNCHQSVKHSAKTLTSQMVETNCIDCHMPLKPSKAISFKLQGQSKIAAYLLRSHKIAVY
ncbi:MAG: multiheme c-type cytochrome [Pedobacter sp.]